MNKRGHRGPVTLPSLGVSVFLVLDRMIRDTGKQNLCTGQSKALNPSGSHFRPLLLTTTTVYNIKMLKISLSLPAHQMSESM